MSFNTQPPEGGCLLYGYKFVVHEMFQHTATRRWLLGINMANRLDLSFQHTATRRWLLGMSKYVVQNYIVSTHSHPKVAAYIVVKSLSL